MDKKEFWEIIDKHKDEDTSIKYENMAKTLSTYSLKDIGEFYELYHSDIAHTLIKNNDLWDLLDYHFNSPLSDDKYHYFIGWLIGQGSKVYEEVVKDYRRITKYIKDRNSDIYRHEDMLYVGFDAYEIVTGKDSEHFVNYFYSK